MSNFGEESIELELFPTPCLMAPWAVVYVLMHVYKCLRDSVVRLSKVECCLRLLTQDEWMVKGTSFGAIVFIMVLTMLLQDSSLAFLPTSGSHH